MKGVGTGDFPEALGAEQGAEVPRLPAATITRIEATPGGEFRAWNRRSLEGKHYVSARADRFHFNIRSEGAASASRP